MALVPETREATLFTMQVPPIEKPIVGKGMLSAPKLSSWEAAFDGNRRRSRILQLPDEILFEIMQMVELDDLYMLRQVSCTFLRIYHDQIFQRLHRKGPSRIFWQWQWQGHRDGFELDPKTVTRARRNVFCDPRFKVKESEEYRSRLKEVQDHIHCSFCNTSHRIFEFSAAQRSNSKEMRQCILAEGFIWLCPHRKVSFRSVRKLAFARDWTSRLAPDDSYTIEWCHKCHLQSASNGWDGRRKELEPPHVILSGLKTPSASVNISINWKVPLFKITPNVDVTMADVQNALKDAEVRYGFKLCPHFSYCNGELLRMLDAQICVCFGNDKRLGIQPMPSPLPEAVPHTTCRHDADVAQRLNRNQSEPQGFMSGTHSTRCDFCLTIYGFKRHGSCVFLFRHTNVEMTAERSKYYSGYGLQRVLEPSSYVTRAAAVDDETKYLMWCDDETCRNGRNWNMYATCLNAY